MRNNTLQRDINIKILYLISISLLANTCNGQLPKRNLISASQANVIYNKDRLGATLEDHYKSMAPLYQQIHEQDIIKQLQTERDKELSKKDASIKQLQTERDKERSEKDASIKQLQTERNKELSKKDASIKQLQTERDKELSKKDASIKQLQTERNKERSEKDACIKQLQTERDKELSKKDASIKQLQTERDKERSEKDACIKQLQTERDKELSKKDASIKQLQAERDKERSEKDACIKQLQTERNRYQHLKNKGACIEKIAGTPSNQEINKQPINQQMAAQVVGNAPQAPPLPPPNFFASGGKQTLPAWKARNQMSKNPNKSKEKEKRPTASEIQNQRKKLRPTMAGNHSVNQGSSKDVNNPDMVGVTTSKYYNYNEHIEASVLAHKNQNKNKKLKEPTPWEQMHQELKQKVPKKD